MSTQAPSAAIPRTGAARPSPLRAALAEAQARYAVPALGAAIVTRTGLDALEVTGVRVRGRDDPIRADDRWHVGSCGKSMTAALYARLVERGDADWGAPLSHLFPDLAATIAPGWERVTVDDVFASEAGLPANLGRAQVLAALGDTRPLVDQRTEVAAAALARPPRRPGRFLYSNLGYIVAGAAIERVTGLTFETALAVHVLEPLGITSAGFGPPRGAWGHGGRLLRLGPLFLDVGRAVPVDPRRAESDNPPVMSPAGRLSLTLEDWARFHRVFLARGGDFLRPETIERLTAPAPGRRQAFGWAPAQGLDRASVGQQGSNTFWYAMALVDRSWERTALVVCNDGRARRMRQLPHLAHRLLKE